MITLTLWIIIAYLLGSLSSAIIVCRLWGLPDPRTEGSKNPGATNVLRIGNKKAAIITLLGDGLKGFIPVLAANYYGIDGAPLALIGLAAFFGHLFPVFFRFEGGKGVATSFGALLGLSWPLGAIAIATWLVVALVFRYSSLAALITALLTPVYAYYFAEHGFVIPLMIQSAFLIFSHRENITRLVQGQETKLGQKKTPSNDNSP